MARPSPRSKSSKRGQHGDAISGNPGQPNIMVNGGGVGSQGPTNLKGPGTEAGYAGKVKGMGGAKKGGK